jgi:hypothetical protein
VEGDNMSVVKTVAIVVGGYLGLKYIFGVDLLASFETSTPAVGTTTSPQAATTTNANAVNTYNLVKAAITSAGVSGLQTVDVWNYYYQQIRGIPGPAPETLFPNNDRNEKYSMDEWWAAMTGQGFSGLGLIAHHVNPYWNPQGTQFGDNLTATGMEMYRKVF